MARIDRLRIAIFHLGFFYSGGGEKLVLEEIRGLRELGYEVECYAPYVDRRSCFPDYDEISDVHSLLPPPPRWLPMKDPIWVLLSTLIIPFLAPKFRKFDIFIGANQPGPWFAFVLGKLLGKPYLIYLAQPLRLLHPREVDLQNGIRIREGDTFFLLTMIRLAGWLIDVADRVSVRNAATVMANGEFVADWLADVYGVKSTVCPAGCYPISRRKLDYTSRWTSQLAVNGAKINKPFVLLTNRHSPMKRFEYAIWAMKQISRQTDQLTLVITGQETEYTEQLRYLVNGLGLERFVTFIGLVPEDELSMLYGNAAAYVYPSPEEDFGMGVVEAMAAGTPVIAWNNGGPTSTVVNGETGFLIEPYDSDEFAEKMLALGSNPSLSESMGRAAHRRAVKQFSYERHTRILAEAVELVYLTHAAPEASKPEPITHSQ